MRKPYIAVAGNIGVGKSSLVNYLAEQYDLVPIYEPFADNPYLEDFYADMRGWAFHSQVWFLSHKFRLHKELERRGQPLVQDRTIYEDAEIFAAYLHRSRRMSPRDWRTYQELYQALQQDLEPPTLLLYLRCGVRAIRRRIRARGRPAEQDIPARYLRTLNHLYEDWIETWDRSPVLTWDTQSQDYLTDLVDRIAFHKAIENHL
ncbi:MAG: deoxynucleoside kinase [Deltaproteobacteria bacterium]|nr:MAG: deoxynucleoside kinase [Deltaproteobacteria bacterium]